MRTLSVDAQALLDRIADGEQIPVVQLVEMVFPTTLRFTTAGHDIEWDGETWVTAGMGTIDAVEDEQGMVQALQFTLPGVTEEQIAIALGDDVDGAVVRVYDALVDPDDGSVADAVLAWAGTLNVPGIEDGATAAIVITAEHRGLHALRPKPRRYTDDEQQRLYPGETSLNIDPATDAGPVAWPAASFFRQ